MGIVDLVPGVKKLKSLFGVKEPGDTSLSVPTDTIQSSTGSLPADQEALVHKHSLDIKFDNQLDEMLTSHTSKRDRLRERGGDLEKYTQDADGMAAVRWELKQQNPDMTSEELAQEFFDQQAYYIWKDSMLDEVVTIIGVEIQARRDGIVVRTPRG